MRWDKASLLQRGPGGDIAPRASADGALAVIFGNLGERCGDGCAKALIAVIAADDHADINRVERPFERAGDAASDRFKIPPRDPEIA